MKKILTIALCMAACMGASAQYICLKQGTTMEYKTTMFNDKDSVTVNSTANIMSIEEKDGVYTVLTQEVTPLPQTQFGEKTDTTTTIYNSTDKTTTFILSTPEEAKQGVIDMVKMQIQASGQAVSVADLEDFISSIRAKGELSIAISPDMAAGTKLPNKSLRINVGQETMSYNIWEAKVVGQETITTAAGTFECTKVSFVNRINAGGENQKINVTEWYAPNIGAVKVCQSIKDKPLMDVELLKITEP